MSMAMAKIHLENLLEDKANRLVQMSFDELEAHFDAFSERALIHGCINSSGSEEDQRNFEALVEYCYQWFCERVDVPFIGMYHPEVL